MRNRQYQNFLKNMNRSIVRTKVSQYPSELKKLKALLTDDVWELFQEAGVIIAGGALTSIFTNKDVNDIDVYFRSEEQLVNVVASIYQNDQLSGDLFDVADQFSMIYNGNSQRTLMFKNEEQHVQFMTFKYFKDVEEIFDTFDFTCCMGAYDFKEKGFILHDDFLKHNAQKYLKFHPGTAYPIMSLMRVDKYRKKGYEISKTELLRICATCMALNISDWEELKDHVGGMYGYDLDDVFDETQEFSLEEFINQMDGIDERDIRSYQTFTGGKDLSDVLKVFVQVDLGDNDPKFNDEKYLYKCVNSDWKSPISSNKVRYEEGEIIESIGSGLFFHKSSSQPYHRSSYWVECELIDGEINNAHSFQKVVVHGKVRVIRNFIYNCNKDEFMNAVLDKYGPGDE